MSHFRNRKGDLLLDQICDLMSGDEDDLFEFLKDLDFTDEELNSVTDELNAYRSIPGTTIKRYINRIVSSLDELDRLPFLKGVMVGIAIRKVTDALEEPDLTEAEKLIDRQIEELRSNL